MSNNDHVLSIYRQNPSVSIKDISKALNISPTEVRAILTKNNLNVESGAGGRRSDLDNAYFRSRWEANYARYLNSQERNGEILRWEFEPHTFYFDQIKRGSIHYTPDFRVWELDGNYTWREIKGYMDQKSRTKLKRFAKYYPEESERLHIIERAGMQALEKMWGRTIPHWEWMFG